MAAADTERAARARHRGNGIARVIGVESRREDTGVDADQL